MLVWLIQAQVRHWPREEQMPTPSYDIGDVRRLAVTFTNLSGANADPTGVSFSIRKPDGTVTAYVYGTDAELVKSATGIYYVDFAVTLSGRHVYRFVGTGAVSTAENGEFYARRNEAAA